MRDRSPAGRDRGQAHTVEAFVAAVILIAGLTFAMQATAVTPLSASTSNQHIENQQRALAGDVLATADDRGDLEEAVLYWNPDPDGENVDPQFYNTSEAGYFQQGGPPLPFGDALNRTLLDRQIAFNVYVRYYRGNTTLGSTRLVYMGSPTDNAVTTHRTVTVYNDTRLTGADDRTLEEVTDDTNSTFYAPNISDTRLYNVMEVRIVAWRM